MSKPAEARKTLLWLVPVAILPALLALPFLLGKVLLFRDILHFVLPEQVFAARALAQGRLPLWNPLVYGGVPYFAELGTGVLYPPNWIFLVLTPGRAATAFVLLHLPVAAFGMLLLARAVRLSPGAMALAATSYVASGYLLSMHGVHYYFASAALLPLCAALLVRCGREGSARATVAAAGAVLALVLNGEVQALGLAALLALALLLDDAGERTLTGACLSLLAAVLLGAGLGAVQLVPAALFTAETVRAHGVPLSESALWSMHPLRLLELIVPQPFGLPWPDNGYWGPPSAPGARHLPWALSLWLGPSALVLAPVALLGRGRTRALLALAALGLLLAAGARTPLFALWHQAVPLANRFRYAEKYALLATAALVLLGACGLDAAREQPRARRAALALFGCGGVLLLAAAIGALHASTFLSAAIAGGLAAAQANLGSEDALAATAGALSQAGGLCLALALALHLSRSRPGWLAPLFVLAGGVAGAANGLRLLSYGDGDFLRAPPRLVAQVRAAVPQGSTGRAFADESCIFAGQGEGPLLERVRRFQWTVGKENFLTLFGVPEVLGYGAAERASQIAQFAALRPFGVLAAARAFGAAVVVGCDGGAEPYARAIPFAIPRVRYARPATAPADPVGRAAALLAARPGTALLDPGPGSALTAGTPAASDGADAAAPEGASDGEPGTAAVIEDRAELVRVRAEGAGGVAVLADVFAPGWSATVDGAPAKVLRADAGFRAVALLPGAHEIAFSYRAPGLALGATLSAGTAVLCALLLLHGERRRRRLSPAGTAPGSP
ncbi:MAG TPA: YfhO family protein [Myxococcales bacterium]|nr:YfhO family protein [Myxococcales bacterium]